MDHTMIVSKRTIVIGIPGRLRSESIPSMMMKTRDSSALITITRPQRVTKRI